MFRHIFCRTWHNSLQDITYLPSSVRSQSLTPCQTWTAALQHCVVKGFSRCSVSKTGSKVLQTHFTDSWESGRGTRTGWYCNAATTRPLVDKPTLQHVSLWIQHICVFNSTHTQKHITNPTQPFLIRLQHHVNASASAPRRDSSDLFNVMNLIARSPTGLLFNGTLLAWTQWPAALSSYSLREAFWSKRAAYLIHQRPPIY